MQVNKACTKRKKNVKKILGKIEIDTFLREKKDFQGISVHLLKNKNTRGCTYNNTVLYTLNQEPGVQVSPTNPGTSPP